MSLLADALVYLVAAVIAVPLAHRLGLGSVLGYLVAGVAIGPALGLVGAEAAEIQHFAELGVVMMLFLVGLELQPAMLWRMRHELVGLGGLQVLLCTGALAGVAVAFGLEPGAALAVGMILALSSTAITLQTLAEKGLLTTAGGQSAFAVLLAQDIAVIPMLALMPLLAAGAASGAVAEGGHAGAALEALPAWAQPVAVLAALAIIVVAGRRLIRPVFRFIAEARLREIFTAAALLLVIAIALLMEAVGLSPALGTFLAGVVLSDSDYRHELESDIAPFKGLLLGLFFVTVGAGIDFGLLIARPGEILGLAAGLLLLKGAILWGLGWAFRLRGADGALFALALAQAGEFAFVLFGVATATGALATPLVQELTLVVALTMLATPGLFLLHERVIAPRLVAGPARAPDPVPGGGQALIAGMGRFGQIVGRLLISAGHRVTILDHDPQTVENLGRIGIRAHYGDATRPDLLEAAGIGEATLFVAALDDRERLTHLVAHVATRYPGVTILARARDRHHVYELEAAGAHRVERELFEGALALGRSALEELGAHPFAAETRARRFRRHDHETLEALREAWHAGGMDPAYIDAMRARTAALAEVMGTDRDDPRLGPERGWAPPPPEARRPR